MKVSDQASRLRQLMRPRRTETIAIASGKGGVGKSCLAANLAILMSAAGRRVALVDADLSLANLDILLNVSVRADISRVVSGACRLSDIVIDLPCGVQLVPGASGLAKLAHLTTFEQARLLEELTALEDENDLVIIDCGAGIGPEVLSFAAAADSTLIVTTPEPTALTDAYALVKVLAARNAHCRMSVVANQATDRREGRETCRRMSAVAKDFLDLELADAGFVPDDAKVCQAVRMRQPLVLACPTCPASRAIAGVAQTLLRRADGRDRGRNAGFFKRVVGWFS